MVNRVAAGCIDPSSHLDMEEDQEVPFFPFNISSSVVVEENCKQCSFSPNSQIKSFLFLPFMIWELHLTTIQALVFINLKILT